MPSPLYVALAAYVDRLKDDLLSLGVEYDQLSQAQLTRALAFRVLASAAVENFVEDRCRQVAGIGTTRFLANQPTRTGRALVIWYNAKEPRGPLALKDAEHVPHSQVDVVTAARVAYESSVKATHGMSGKDLAHLVWPLGCRDGDVDQILVDLLQSWSTQRDRAVHTRLQKMRAETTPDGEWKIVNADLMPLLEALDEKLEEIATTY